jgi:hypothetical protein
MKMAEAKPCPGCGGEKEYLWVGNLSSSLVGVRCLRCRLQVDVNWMGLPNPADSVLKGMDRIEWMKRESLYITLSKWNRLPRLQVSVFP